jgi:hypothetical protein
MSDGLNEQTYAQWPGSSTNYDYSRSGEMSQNGRDETASTTSVPKDSQPEEAIAGATPTNGEHTRKTARNLRTTLGLGKKRDNFSRD